MSIVLDHTIVPARDKEASARFFARIFCVEYQGLTGHFAPVKVNETLTLDFDDAPAGFRSQHYAFKIGDEDIDPTLEGVKAEGIAFGSGPRSRTDGKLNDRSGGRGFYFDDPDGHVYEVLTR